MPKFEILIPKTPKIPMDLRLRLEAESWIDALKMGRKKLGESAAVTDNVLVDIKPDNTIHVTDAGTGQVFRITELTEGESAPAVAPAPAPAPAPVAPPAPVVPSVAAKPEPAVQPKPAPQPAPAPKVAPAPVARPKPVEVPAQPFGEPQGRQSPPIGRAIDATSESTADFLEEIFELTEDVNTKRNRQEALDFMLDLAMKRVGTDAGSILIADINKYYLEFAAVRGPKADAVKKFQVSMGQGLAGFSAEEAVGVAVSDVTRDPRFYSAISEKIGYPTRSILCVPIQVDGRVFGTLELINRQQNDSFSERDLGVANFIATQLAQYLERQEP